VHAAFYAIAMKRRTRNPVLEALTTRDFGSTEVSPGNFLNFAQAPRD
jgi:hypothetical protein